MICIGNNTKVREHNSSNFEPMETLGERIVVTRAEVERDEVVGHLNHLFDLGMRNHNLLVL